MGSSSKWKTAKMALTQNLCKYVPRRRLETEECYSSERLSDVALLSPPMTPTPSSHGLRLSKVGNKSSKQTCAICLTKMKQGDGHAIFTAECSHSFHFHCIASNVKFGNHICPICRAKWKEIPLQAPSFDPPLLSVDAVGCHETDSLMTLVQQLPTPRRNLGSKHVAPFTEALEPSLFDDDESVDRQHTIAERSESKSGAGKDFSGAIDIKTHTEVSAASQSDLDDKFTILVHLKAPTRSPKTPLENQASLSHLSQTCRAPVDLVTVLDISGSMGGTKLALLKRAMGFLIHNLGSNDRLSVIAFSSTARRLFPLRRMSNAGHKLALQAVNSLFAHGGTNIAEGLRKGAKVMAERWEKNPVSSIILLSDGQDTYTASESGVNQPQPNYQSPLPLSIYDSEGSVSQIPVHAFGFGADHDASLLHSISELSGGTFSFIETETVMQDAFAQCIGGLLSVVVQQLQVQMECVHPSARLCSIEVGSYTALVTDDATSGLINIGDLYADEEKDFLLSVTVHAESSKKQTPLLKVRCLYKDPLTEEMATMENDEIILERPGIAGGAVVSIEMDKQRNRFQAAEAMSQAKAAAEQGDLAGAVFILENLRKKLSETISSKDPFCRALDTELKQMQERMSSRRIYKTSGRAYILSGLSSHSWQRATARGDSTDGSSLVRSYQTPSMTEMVTKSQAMLLGSPSAKTLVQPLCPMDDNQVQGDVKNKLCLNTILRVFFSFFL